MKGKENFKKWFGDSVVKDAFGKPVPVYHGTDRAGFIEFYERGDGKPGYFFTDDVAMADSYVRKGPTHLVEFAPEVFDTPGEAINLLQALEEDHTALLSCWLSDDGLEGQVNAEGVDAPLFAWEMPDPDDYEDGAEDEEYLLDLEAAQEDLLEDFNTEVAGVPMCGNIYEVYLRIEDPLVIDAKGENWDSIEFVEADEDGNPTGYRYTTNEVGHLALDMGHDGVIIKNVNDNGGGGSGYYDTATVYIVFSSNQIKAVDNNGKWSLKSPSIVNGHKRKGRLRFR